MVLCTGCVPHVPDADLNEAAQLNAKLGIQYLEQGQLAMAKAKLLHAQSLAPELPEVHYSYAYFLEKTGEFKSAEAAYQHALTLDPQSGKAHNNYAVFLCKQNRIAQAEAHFQQAVADTQYPWTAEAYENAGFCLLNQDALKARQYFEKALQYDPHRVLAKQALREL